MKRQALLVELENARQRVIALEKENHALRAYTNRLEQRIGQDQVTGMPNRYLLQDRLNHAINQMRRQGSELAVVFLDLDRFKTINDSLGHEAGDALLRAVAQRLHTCLRKSDTIARLGGDEFAIVLEYTGKSEAQQVADKLIETMKSAFDWKEQQCYIDCSIGISLYPDDGHEADILLSHADTAMHWVKMQGRNGICFYNNNMDNWSGQRLSLETDLRHALEREQLVLHYQPQVDLASGRLIGCEALLRWQHPERGLIPPAAFIPLAEESGLIVPIGIWVMHAAWQQLAKWRSDGLNPNRVAVNLSPRQFLHNQLVSDIEETINQVQISPVYLELEITETLLMQDVERAIDCLKALENMGLRLAVDDFGTGYSSLNYLKRLPIHCLKIDQSFVRDITTDMDDAAIASTVIAMAHNMRLEVIAEGVETEAQLGFLRARNCNGIQGYYISRPLPADEFTRWMKSSPPRLLARTESKTRTLLIVDDDEDMLALLSLYLEQDDYRIITANNGSEGLNMMARMAVDVVLTDYRMPDMDGTEFLRLISAIYPQTVRIMLTASSDIEILARAVNDGALFRFLFKPVDEIRLRETVREAFLIRYKL